MMKSRVCLATSIASPSRSLSSRASSDSSIASSSFSSNCRAEASSSRSGFLARIFSRSEPLQPAVRRSCVGSGAVASNFQVVVAGTCASKRESLRLNMHSVGRHGRCWSCNACPETMGTKMAAEGAQQPRRRYHIVGDHREALRNE
jgi:hypothetical protein